MGMADRRRAGVEEFVRGSLEPGESIVATLSFAQTGGPTAGTLGVVGALLSKYGAVAVTDRRVLLVKMSGMARPQAVAASAPRGEVRAREYKPGFPAIGWKGLALSGLGADEVQLRVPRPHREELAAVLRALT